MMLLLLASCSDNALSKLNTAPVAQILSSSDVLNTTEGTAWTLRGSASDADDDSASLLASWRLNDAEICAGAAPGADGTTTCAVDAPVGTAVIQLEVRDPSGATGVDDLVIEVSPNTAPTASISAPGEGEQLESGAAVEFVGLVGDAEDAVTALLVTWSDSVDGALDADATDGAGSSVGASSFSIGDHTLTLSVEDSLGLTESDSVSFTVVAPNSPPSAPSVTITPRSPGEGDGLLCAITTPSSDPDGDVVTYTFAWDADGISYTGATTTTEGGDTIPGGVTIEGEVWTCTVTPEDGAEPGTAVSANVTIGASSSLCPDGNCALRYDGGTAYVEVPDAPTLDGGGSALTVEAWVYYDSVTSNCMTTVRKGTSASATYDYWLHKNYAPGDSLFWGSWNGWTTQAFSAVSVGRWYHYAGTYDPGTGAASIWIDGALTSTSSSYGTPAANTDPLRIGIDWDLGCDTWGVIDEVRISNSVRYTAAFTPSTTFTPDANTMALWHFDEFTGNVASDSSGNGNDGVIHGAAWTTESP